MFAISSIFLFVFIEHGKAFFTIFLLMFSIWFMYGLNVEKEKIVEIEKFEILEKHVNEEALINTHYFLVNDSGERRAINVPYKLWLESEIGDDYVISRGHVEYNFYLYGKEM